MKRLFLSLPLLAGLALLIVYLFTGYTNVAEKPPNLVYMFSDQHRVHALGIWSDPDYRDYLSTKGDPVVTPNLDQMAKEGVLFTQVTSTHPVCSPHRAMLMSGMFPDQNGIRGANAAKGRPQSLRHDIKCLTDVLYYEGYETAYFGKVHWERNEALFDKDGNYAGTTEAPGGYTANAQDTYVPPGEGRHSNQYWLQALRHDKDPHLFSSDPALVGGRKDGEIYKAKGFKPVIETNAIVDYIKNTRGQRDPAKPFSIIWSTHPPHTPYENVKDTDEQIYNKYYKDIPVEKLRVRDNVHNHKPWNKNKKLDPIKSTPIYFSHVTAVDQQVGRVMAALEEIGEADNTIIVFSSDHGEMMGSHQLMTKNFIYDESFLVPFIIRYPGIRPRVENLLMGTFDVMPTLMGLMGLKERIPKTVQGTNYSRGLATGNYDETPRPVSAPYLHGKDKGVKTNRYTYLVKSNGKVEIYNNEADPYQIRRLGTKDIPGKDLRLLKMELGNWLSRAGDVWAEQKKYPESVTYPTKNNVSVTGVAILPPHHFTLARSEKSQLKLRLAPANARNKNVTWVSDDEKVASVSSSGVVTGIGSGSATIKVMSEDGGFAASISVTVTDEVSN